jgi:hypothetical protein
MLLTADLPACPHQEPRPQISPPADAIQELQSTGMPAQRRKAMSEFVRRKHITLIRVSALRGATTTFKQVPKEGNPQGQQPS